MTENLIACFKITPADNLELYEL